MKLETIAAVLPKAVSTGGVGAAMLTLSPWAWAAALIGAALSFYFEPEKTPKEVRKLLFGIVATGFAAALVAAAAPHVPLLGWTENIDVGVRAGLLGLSVRFLMEQGKKRLGKMAEKES